MLSSRPTEICLNLTMALKGNGCYCPCFIDEEAEGQIARGQCQDLNLGLSDSKHVCELPHPHFKPRALGDLLNGCCPIELPIMMKMFCSALPEPQVVTEGSNSGQCHSGVKLQISFNFN